MKYPRLHLRLARYRRTVPTLRQGRVGWAKAVGVTVVVCAEAAGVAAEMATEVAAEVTAEVAAEVAAGVTAGVTAGGPFPPTPTNPGAGRAVAAARGVFPLAPPLGRGAAASREISRAGWVAAAEWPIF